MSDNDIAEQTGTLVALLGASAVLVLTNIFWLGIAIGFGPGGFGSHLSSTKVLIEELGQGCGFAGLLLGPAAVIWASIGTLALKSGRARNRGLKWIVGAQALATVGLIASIY